MMLELVHELGRSSPEMMWCASIGLTSMFADQLISIEFAFALHHFYLESKSHPHLGRIQKFASTECVCSFESMRHVRT